MGFGPCRDVLGKTWRTEVRFGDGWRQGIEGGKNADVTMWVFGHVRSTCAELMVFFNCTI